MKNRVHSNACILGPQYIALVKICNCSLAARCCAQSPHFHKSSAVISRIHANILSYSSASCYYNKLNLKSSGWCTKIWFLSADAKNNLPFLSLASIVHTAKYFNYTEQNNLVHRTPHSRPVFLTDNKKYSFLVMNWIVFMNIFPFYLNLLFYLPYMQPLLHIDNSQRYLSITLLWYMLGSHLSAKRVALSLWIYYQNPSAFQK